jgi:hypothetical protein
MAEKIKGRRFEMIYKQGIGLASTAKILVDMDTGVQYLSVVEGYAGGLSPLLDPEGKPLLAPFAQMHPEEK